MPDEIEIMRWEDEGGRPSIAEYRAMHDTSNMTAQEANARMLRLEALDNRIRNHGRTDMP